jgi:hypothetical protein
MPQQIDCNIAARGARTCDAEGARSKPPEQRQKAVVPNNACCRPYYTIVMLVLSVLGVYKRLHARLDCIEGMRERRCHTSCEDP